MLEKGYSQQPASDHPGISLSALGRWVRAESKPMGQESTAKKLGLNLANQDELTRLRKENEQLPMAREILKNRLPGSPVPYAKKQVALTLIWRADIGRLLFGGSTPRQKTWPMGSCGPNCGGTSRDPV